jgi:uncharacterized protein (TIGR03546 family)
VRAHEAIRAPFEAISRLYRKGIRMQSAIVAPLRSVVQALLRNNSSSQLAAGFALGMIVGLMPKGNLIALSLFVMLFSLRCNVGISLVAVVMFSFAATWTDPVAHKLGVAVLSMEPLQATYASVFNLPLGPWLGFDNSVVTGSLLLGLWLAYPVYWITRTLCEATKRETAI